MRYLIFILVFICFNLRAQVTKLPAKQPVHLIAKINSFDKEKIDMKTSSKEVSHAIRLGNPHLEKVLKSLGPDDEALLKGHIVYEKLHHTNEDIIGPVFVIESVKPISLKRLGKTDDFKVAEKEVTFQLKPAPYAPGTIQTTGAVVSALTITASILLLKSLTAAPTDQALVTNTNGMLMFSAGALASGLFIFDQVKESKPTK